MKLTKRLWSESPAFAKARRLRFAVLSPVALFAGGLWGSLLGTGTGILAGAAVTMMPSNGAFSGQPSKPSPMRVCTLSYPISSSSAVACRPSSGIISMV